MPSAPRELVIRTIRPEDREQWSVLWDGYNAFYGRKGPTALAPAVTRSTWERFQDPNEPVHALVAELEGRLVGLAHYLFHRSTNTIGEVCYLQDLFTDSAYRGRGIARALIEAVYARASEAGAERVYWHTQESNAGARLLYDKVAKMTGFIVYRKDP
jgi:GNAT superfamily N-acetyltransferase